MDVGPADEELFQPQGANEPSISWSQDDSEDVDFSRDEVILLVQEDNSQSSSSQYGADNIRMRRAAAPEDSKKCPVCETPVHKRSLKRHIMTQVRQKITEFLGAVQK